MRVLSSARSPSCSWASALSSSALPGSSLPFETTSFAFSRSSSFFLPPPNRSLSPIRVSSLAEVLDHLGGRLARLAEGDEAVAAQHRLLAPQHDLGAFDGEPRSVGAAVGQEELVLALLDLAVHARGHALGDHEV